MLCKRCDVAEEVLCKRLVANALQEVCVCSRATVQICARVLYESPIVYEIAHTSSESARD